MIQPAAGRTGVQLQRILKLNRRQRLKAEVLSGLSGRFKALLQQRGKIGSRMNGFYIRSGAPDYTKCDAFWVGDRKKFWRDASLVPAVWEFTTSERSNECGGYYQQRANRTTTL